MPELLIRPAAAADIAAIAGIYAHAVRCGTASFELEPPDEAEMGRRPWAALAKAASQEAFCGLVDCLRAGGALRNDDVTLVSVEVAA